MLDGKGVERSSFRCSVQCVFSDGASNPLAYTARGEFVFFWPLDACGPLQEHIFHTQKNNGEISFKKNTEEQGFVVLVFPGNCSLEKKIENIEKNKTISGAVFVSDLLSIQKKKVCFVGCELLFPALLVPYSEGKKLFRAIEKKRGCGSSITAILKYDKNKKNAIAITKLVFFSLCICIFFFFVSVLIRKASFLWKEKWNSINARKISGLHFFKKLRYKGEENCTPEVCVVCLNDFESGDQLLQIPCGHVFHYLCAKTVLLGIDCTCPICKEKIQPLHGLST